MFVMEKDPEKTPEQPIEEAALAPVPDEVIDEIPDGGLIAWLQVAGSFALFFNSWYVLTPFPGSSEVARVARA